MPYVPVPKDLSRVKNKIAFNLTRRQLVCFALAGAVGIPFYLFSRSAIGTDAAALCMIGLMLPFFAVGMYEKDGQPPPVPPRPSSISSNRPKRRRRERPQKRQPSKKEKEK